MSEDKSFDVAVKKEFSDDVRELGDLASGCPDEGVSKDAKSTLEACVKTDMSQQYAMPVHNDEEAQTVGATLAKENVAKLVGEIFMAQDRGDGGDCDEEVEYDDNDYGSFAEECDGDESIISSVSDEQLLYQVKVILSS
jgi:hypothetical protein